MMLVAALRPKICMSSGYSQNERPGVTGTPSFAPNAACAAAGPRSTVSSFGSSGLAPEPGTRHTGRPAFMKATGYGLVCSGLSVPGGSTHAPPGNSVGSEPA